VYRRLPGLSIRATEFVVELAERELSDSWNASTGRRKELSIREALRLALCWLRRNMTFSELGEDFGLGKTTAWEYAHDLTAFLADTIGVTIEDLKDEAVQKIFLVDGTLVPTFNWRHRRDLQSGKHKRYGTNVQVVSDIHGRVEGVGGPFPGSWHDKHCYDEAGLSEMVAAAGGGGVGDSGYQGTDLVTPIKKKPAQELTDAENRFNAGVASLRVGVEHAIAHIKNWRIMASRYRGELTYRFENVVLAVGGLQALNDRLSDRKLSFARFKTI
jgi:hypothetical protein